MICVWFDVVDGGDLGEYHMNLYRTIKLTLATAVLTHPFNTIAQASSENSRISPPVPALPQQIYCTLGSTSQITCYCGKNGGRGSWTANPAIKNSYICSTADYKQHVQFYNSYCQYPTTASGNSLTIQQGGQGGLTYCAPRLMDDTGEQITGTCAEVIVGYRKSYCELPAPTTD